MSSNSLSIQGTRLTRGIAIGPALVFTHSAPEVEQGTTDNPDAELDLLRASISQVSDDLDALTATQTESLGAKEAAIFQAHKQIIRDPELFNQVSRIIQTKHLPAAQAWHRVLQSYIELYKASGNPVMAERAADVEDAGNRVLSLLTGTPMDRPSPDRPVILITDELSPSDAATLQPEYILGIVCERGSATSHSGIVLQSLGIPALIGVSGLLEEVHQGDPCILDADKAILYRNPDDELRTAMQRKLENWQELRRQAEAGKSGSVFTPNGEPVQVLANVSEPAQVAAALEQGAEGIGLYRTEFLFMGRDKAPDEDEQYEVYREAVRLMEGKPVIFRTIDIGGDKPVDYLSIEKEENPFLGWRGIRFSLDKPEVFRAQIRAMLRASAHGPIHIMFPMIAELDEWKQARAMVLEEQEKLGVDTKGIRLGLMIEVPAAAIRIQDFLEEADFVSIGTNDLTQYIMATDRTNTRVAARASYTKPAVTDLIASVIKACNERQIPVSLCGEMARDTEVTPLLLEMGLRRFSMSPNGIPEFKLHLKPYGSQR